MRESPRPAITLLAFGRVTTGGTENLVRRVGAIEQIDLRLEHDAAISANVAAINRAIDAAACDWVLLVRAHESIGEPLADEIVAATGAEPRAWGFRIRTQPTYRGKPLRLEPPDEGELRLLHRRHARFRSGGEPGVQGPVIRVTEALEAVSFATVDEHERWLAGRARRRGTAGRVAVFLADAVRCGPIRAGRNGLRYLWVNAAWAREAAPRVE